MTHDRHPDRIKQAGGFTAEWWDITVAHSLIWAYCRLTGPALHPDGDVRGFAEGFKILPQMLDDKPAVASFIASKIHRRFPSEDPTFDRASATFEGVPVTEIALQLT